MPYTRQILTDSNQYFVGNEYIISLQDVYTDR